MFYLKLLFLLTLTRTYKCQEVNEYFENINEKLLKFNQISASITWEYSVNPGNTDLVYKSAEVQKKNIKWQHETCDKLATLQKHHLLNSTQVRQTYLLCRGTKYNFNEARLASQLYEELQTIYTEAVICIPTDNNSNDLKEKETAILKYLTAQDYSNFEKGHLNLKNSLDNTAQEYSNIESGNLNLKNELNKNYLCLRGDEDFEKLMEFSRNELVLKWVWTAWRDIVGPPMREPYLKFVNVQNLAARRNAYPNLGASWRDELEIPNLRQVCQSLLNKVKPLYTLLHGVTRYFLRKQYGKSIVSETGPIPAHLLGNLWSQNWEPLTDLIISNDVDLNENMKKLIWTVDFMVKRAADFYQSLGLPPMTDTFWRESVFARENQLTRCHGTAADLFKEGDYRLLYCSNTTKNDFYVLHHEMGHIQYYMAYEKQPAIFRQANAALHESIGDAIMIGAMTPQHLHRLGLINDSLLYNNENQDHGNSINDVTRDDDIGRKNNNIIVNFDGINNERYEVNNNFNENNDVDTKSHKSNSFNDNDRTIDKLLNILNNDADFDINKNIDQEIFNDEVKETSIEKAKDELFKSVDAIIMLKQALNKIPQIPFSLLVDEFRWKLFEGSVDLKDINGEFWKMAYELQGIMPPGVRDEKQFDVGAMFHVPDNTPYIRYFLSSFLQHQLFESLCKAAVFGRRDAKKPLPETITLNRCDIYGSKAAGKVLKDLMSRGHSQHWRDILHQTIGHDHISASSLIDYYRPLYDKLRKLVKLYNIPLGW